MSVFVLQIIAMISMLCDHLATVFFENNIVLRMIGRFAFIIYAFLLAEGFRHFKDDKKRVLCHLRSYVILALISEPCYDLLFKSPNIDIGKAMTSQSVMVTLLIGFLCLIALNVWQDKTLRQICVILVGVSCALIMRSDYNFAGVLLICAFYFYVSNFLNKSYIKRFFCLLGILILYLLLFHWVSCDFSSLDVYVSRLNAFNAAFYVMHIIVVLLLLEYKGRLGFYSSGFKKLYKSFYPLHLFVLIVLSKI